MNLPSALPIAVLDSNVLVPTWSRFVLQRLAMPPHPRYSPVWSEWIIAESWRVLTWRWMARSAATHPTEWRALARTANTMLRQLLQVMTLVSLRGYLGPEPWPGLMDEEDIPIWQTAVIAQAQYVVSHNLADFPPVVQGRHVFGGIEYLTAIEFVEGVLGESATEVYGAPLPPGALLHSRRASP